MTLAETTRTIFPSETEVLEIGGKRLKFWQVGSDEDNVALIWDAFHGRWKLIIIRFSFSAVSNPVSGASGPLHYTRLVVEYFCQVPIQVPITSSNSSSNTSSDYSSMKTGSGYLKTEVARSCP